MNFLRSFGQGVGMTGPRPRNRLLPPLTAVLALMVSGCGNVDALLEYDQVVRQRLDYQPGVSEIYCYRTLATVDCFAEPQPGPPNRLVNAYEDLESE